MFISLSDIQKKKRTENYDPKALKKRFFTTSLGNVEGVDNFLSSVSSQQKFEATDQRYSPWTDRPVSQLLVTTPCYNSILFRK